MAACQLEWEKSDIEGNATQTETVEGGRIWRTCCDKVWHSILEASPDCNKNIKNATMLLQDE